MHINIIIYAVIYKCNNLSSDFCKYVIDQCAERERVGEGEREAVFMWPGLQNELENNTKNEMEMKVINR